jgi:3-methyladenine DNA glycosylase AlkD
MTPLLRSLQRDLQRKANKKRAAFVQGYFKTGKGEYGEGDVFLGLSVPEQRKIAHTYIDLDPKGIQELLKSKIHEYRFVALEIMTAQFEKASPTHQEKIVDAYFKNTQYINNWDLVDTSAPYILGPYFLDRDKQPLYRLVKSKNIWERRIAILTTYHFIKQGKFSDTFAIAKILLEDTHDLIHKAVGWMLREIGKRSGAQEEVFLKKYAAVMPRTMLRYALEKFPENKRKHYLAMAKVRTSIR